MPATLDAALAAWRDRFARLVVNVRHGRASPHKICMLLATLDLARAGALADNRVVFGPPLLERYRRFFDAVRAPGDQLSPWFPFFHLGGRLRGGEAMVEAAHIHPFGEAGDDDPCNGLALTPDMHWAMDRNLIAPGPDFRWHVSPSLDRRIQDLRLLCELADRPLLLPAEPRMYPRQEVLTWRMERLRDADWTAPDSTRP